MIEEHREESSSGSNVTSDISSPIIVAGLINGMIGSIMIVLPELSIKAGWGTTLLVIISTGIMSYFSSYLYLKHLSDEYDLDISFQKHMWNKKIFRIAYNLFAFLNLYLISVQYFKLIVLQWQYELGQQYSTFQISVVNAIALFLVILMFKYFNKDVKIMGYCVLAIICYVVLLIYMSISNSQNITKQNLQVKGDEKSFDKISSAMAQGFMIQVFFLPYMKKSNKSTKNIEFTSWTYLFGTILYILIAFLGLLSICGRSVLDQNSETILKYFKRLDTTAILIQTFYLSHLYIICPQYILISKDIIYKLLSSFGYNPEFHEQQHNATIRLDQLIIIVVVLVISVIIANFNIDITFILGINGSLISFFIIYLLPSLQHIRCRWKTHKYQLYRPSSANLLAAAEHALCDLEKTRLPLAQQVFNFIMILIMCSFGAFIIFQWINYPY